MLFPMTVCSKEPEWKALEASKALTSWALTDVGEGPLVRELITYGSRGPLGQAECIHCPC